MLKIDLEKSKSISIGSVLSLEEMVDILGCRVGWQPSKDLTLPLDVIFKSWKKACIMEKTIPTKKGVGCNTLSSHSIYFISLFLIPRMVNRKMEKIQMDFL